MHNATLSAAAMRAVVHAAAMQTGVLESGVEGGSGGSGGGGDCWSRSAAWRGPAEAGAPRSQAGQLGNSAARRSAHGARKRKIDLFSHEKCC